MESLATAALNEKAVNVFLKYGFRPFSQNPLQLKLPIKSIGTLN